MSATLAPSAPSAAALLSERERSFTVEEYHAMGRAGVLRREDGRTELIAGRIVAMSPVGTRHLLAVNRLTNLFVRRLAPAAPPVADLSVQNPVRLGPHYEPEPDLALLRPDLARFPTAADALLVVEVSDSTARYDQEVKAPLYAAAGIPELWVVLLDEEVVQVYREPSPDGYAHIARHEAGDELGLVSLPDLPSLPVADVLGKK